MSSNEQEEEVAGGRIGQAVGKVKAAVGSLVGDEDLQREGNLQQAQVDAEAVAARDAAAAEKEREAARVAEERAEVLAERDSLRAEVTADEQAARIEQAEDAADARVEAEARGAAAEVGRDERQKERALDVTERAVEHQREAGLLTALELEQQAERAEQVADAFDPETK